jgi:AraC-like DNA-binding protein
VSNRDSDPIAAPERTPESHDSDERLWTATDHPGETLSLSTPRSGVELMSVRGSRRHWRAAHESFTFALLSEAEPGLRVEWQTRGVSATTLAGQVMCIEPGEIHVTKRLYLGARAADFEVVRFSRELCEQASRDLGARGAFHLDVQSSADPAVRAALSSLVAAVAQRVGRFERECRVAECLSTLVRATGEHRVTSALDPVRDYRLRRIRDYLKSHVREKPSLDELERVATLSRFRLCALWKRTYGVSLGQYWNLHRLEHAVTLLRAGASARTVAADLGYTDESYLSRVVKAHYGIPPGALARRPRR